MADGPVREDVAARLDEIVRVEGRRMLASAPEDSEGRRSGPHPWAILPSRAWRRINIVGATISAVMTGRTRRPHKRSPPSHPLIGVGSQV